jgi:hypothetical protein
LGGNTKPIETGFSLLNMPASKQKTLLSLRILLMPKYIEWEVSTSILKPLVEGFTVSNNIFTMNNYKY